MNKTDELLTILEQKLSTVKVVSDLLYAKLGDSATAKSEDEIVHFRASEVENLLITIENFVEDQESLIRDFIEQDRRSKKPQQINNPE